MRLSTRLFVALAVLAGALFGFSPDASAHKNTGTTAEMLGTIQWPQQQKSFFDLARGVDAGNNGDLTLDNRKGTSAVLNGCRLAGGNTAEGLPVGDALPTPLLVDNDDLCFEFGSFEINAAGVWEGRKHLTRFACDSSGTWGASGSRLPGTPPRADSYYGEFTCNGSSPGGPLEFVPSADGRYNGYVSVAGRVGLFGEINCSVASGETTCPHGLDRAKGDGLNEPPDTWDNRSHAYDKSRIKHTLACVGEIKALPTDGNDPDALPFNDKDGDTVPDTIVEAAVTLVCLIV